MIWTTKGKDKGVITFESKDAQGLGCEIKVSKTTTQWHVTDLNINSKIAYAEASHPIEAIKAINATIKSYGELNGSKEQN